MKPTLVAGTANLTRKLQEETGEARFNATARERRETVRQLDQSMSHSEKDPRTRLGYRSSRPKNADRSIAMQVVSSIATAEAGNGQPS